MLKVFSPLFGDNCSDKINRKNFPLHLCFDLVGVNLRLQCAINFLKKCNYSGDGLGFSVIEF